MMVVCAPWERDAYIMLVEKRKMDNWLVGSNQSGAQTGGKFATLSSIFSLTFDCNFVGEVLRTKRRRQN